MYKKIICGLICLSLLTNAPFSYAGRTADSFDIRRFLATNKIASVEDYANWLPRHMRYIADTGGDRWAAPEETIKNGGGDCEDLAFLSAAVLKAFGIDARVVAHGDFKNGHVYCIFKYNGLYYTFENNHFANTKQRSLKEMALYLGKTQHSQYLAELNLEKKDVRFLYFIRYPKA